MLKQVYRALTAELTREALDAFSEGPRSRRYPAIAPAWATAMGAGDAIFCLSREQCSKSSCDGCRERRDGYLDSLLRRPVDRRELFRKFQTGFEVKGGERTVDCLYAPSCCLALNRVPMLLVAVVRHCHCLQNADLA